MFRAIFRQGPSICRRAIQHEHFRAGQPHGRYFRSMQTSSDSQTQQWDGLLTQETNKIAVDASRASPTVKEVVTPQQLWEQRSKAAKKFLEDHPPHDAYTGLSHVSCVPHDAQMFPVPGRSVRVTGGKIADACKKLDAILNRNKVRITLRAQERHEKKGVKRRRLSSERWRRLFAHEVGPFSSGSTLCSHTLPGAEKRSTGDKNTETWCIRTGCFFRRDIYLDHLYFCAFRSLSMTHRVMFWAGESSTKESALSS